MTATTLSRIDHIRAAWAAMFVCALAPIIAASGGLAMAPLMALAGLVAFPLTQWRSRIRLSLGLLLAAGFLLWAGITQTWSPSPPDQFVKIIAGIVLFSAFAMACAGIPARQRGWTLDAALGFAIVLGAILVFEALSGASLTRMIKGLSPDSVEVTRNIGRGATIYLAILGPAVIIAGARFRRGIWLAGGLVAAGAVAAFSFELAANALAFLLGFAAFAAAFLRPRTSLFLLSLLIACWIIAAPLVMMIILPLSEDINAAIPFSWEWRVESWANARELIAQKPIFGWGMDAARTFDETVELRGHVLDRMPLHPHSVALQIWLELGLVGAVMSAALVLSIGDMISQRLLRGPAAAAAASMTVMALLSFVSVGMWQEWWWATAFLASALVILIGPASSPRNETSST